MIITVIENLKSRYLFLKTNIESLELKEETIRLLKVREGYHIELTASFSFLDEQLLKQGSTVKLLHKFTGEVILLYASIFLEGFTHFQKYAIEKAILTIGNIGADIVIPDQRIQEKISIDFTKQEIQNANPFFVAMNHNCIQEATFKNGDCLQILDIQLLFHESFFMMNYPSAIEVNLTPYKIPKEAKQLPTHTLIETKKRPCIKEKPVPMEVLFEEPIKLHSVNRNPLIFMMGPALMMSFATLLSGSLMFYQGLLNGRRPIEMLPMVLLPGVMLLSTLLWNPLQRIYEKHKQTKEIKERNHAYREYLLALDKTCRKHDLSYQKEMEGQFPSLHSIFEGNMIKQFIYERECDDYRFLSLRLGMHKESSITFKQSFKLDKKDEIRHMIDHFQKKYDKSCPLPYVLGFKNYQSIGLIDVDGNGFTNLLFPFAFFHNPNDLKIVVYGDQTFFKQHLFLYNLPHIHHNGSLLLVDQKKHLDSLLLELKNKGYAVLIFATKHIPNIDGIYQIQLLKEFQYGFDVLLHPSDRSIFMNNQWFSVDFDNFEITEESFSIFTYYKAPGSINEVIESPSFYSIHNLKAIDNKIIHENWRKNHVYEGMIAHIGAKENGEVIYLNLHEDYEGPHGLIAGMTGSGKSELLLTLIYSLCINYSPHELQFVLIDFKGGGLSSNFFMQEEYEPHICNVLTNLDESEIKKAILSLELECRYREALFQEVSKQLSTPIYHIHQYQRMAALKHWKYLPSLVIIVDEFAELKRDYPDFLQELIRIARVGRSLGIHLILSTQKPSGIVSEQIWANAQFKICLKVQDEIDSKEVLKVSDAAYLREKGEFYCISNHELEKGRSGYIHALYETNPKRMRLLDFCGKEIETFQAQTEVESYQMEYILNALLCMKHDLNIPSYRIWLPPLYKKNCPNPLLKEGIPIGEMDCIDLRKQIPLSFQEESLLVVSPNREEKKQFFLLLLDRLSLLDDCLLFIIDDLEIVEEKTQYFKNCLGITNSEEQDYLYRFMKHLKEGHLPPYKELYVVITDMTIFLKSELQDSVLQLVMDKAAFYRIKLISFSSLAASIPYRIFMRMQMRISLYNDSSQDLVYLFEQGSIPPFLKKGYGLIKYENLYKFCYYRHNLSFLDKNHNEIALPHIPKVISMNMQSSFIDIGQSIEQAQMVRLEKGEMVALYLVDVRYDSIVFSNYQDSFVFHQANESFVCTKNQIHFVLLDSSALSHYLQMNQLPKHLLLIGNIKNQYLIPIPKIITFKENYGLYMHDGKKELIQLAE